MNERYFIIFFWGLRTKMVKVNQSMKVIGEYLPPLNKQVETFFYSNMDCITENGEFINCQEITAEAKKLIDGCTELVITNIIEIKSKEEFEFWKKKQPTVTDKPFPQID